MMSSRGSSGLSTPQPWEAFANNNPNLVREIEEEIAVAEQDLKDEAKGIFRPKKKKSHQIMKLQQPMPTKQLGTPMPSSRNKAEPAEDEPLPDAWEVVVEEEQEEDDDDYDGGEPPASADEPSADASPAAVAPPPPTALSRPPPLGSRPPAIIQGAPAAAQQTGSPPFARAGAPRGGA